MHASHDLTSSSIWYDSSNFQSMHSQIATCKTMNLHISVHMHLIDWILCIKSTSKLLIDATDSIDNMFLSINVAS